MRISHVSIRNFRSFQQFALQLQGNSVFIIGENAGGKTALLTAIARALGRDLNFTKADFYDPQSPIEIEVTLMDLNGPQRGLFGNYIHFAAPPTLTVGVRAIWDASEEAAELEHGYPRHPGSRSKREEREGLLLHWLPAGRDPGKMLQFGYIRNIMGSLLSGAAIEQAIEEAVADVRHASEKLGQNQALSQLLNDARASLAQLLPGIPQNAFAMGTAALTGRDLLRQFELQMTHARDPVAVSRQSSGLSQLAVFVFAIEVAKAQPGTLLLIDEPEISLHPQAQRALMRLLQKSGSQLIIATHSSNLLDRIDPRKILRLKQTQTGEVQAYRPTTISDRDAMRLIRHTNPHTAEAFFARSVILVEGLSDQYALAALAERLGRNLDAEGIEIVPIGGAFTIGTYVELFGPRGFSLKVAGLCDAAEEHLFKKALEGTGITINNRTDMENTGFYVCVSDLEDELIRAITPQIATTIIAREGDEAEFKLLQQQPRYQSAPLHEQVSAFIAKHKIRYAPLLVDELDIASMPAPLTGVLNSV